MLDVKRRHITAWQIADRAVLAAISRRKLVGGAAGVLAGFAATGMFNRAGAAPLQKFGLANYLAQTLPDDAAPPKQQTFVVPADPTIPKVLDFYEAVYERPSGRRLGSLQRSLGSHRSELPDYPRRCRILVER